MTETTASGPFLTPKRAEMLRDYVPFIAIVLVILLFWAISGDRFMSMRNWTFIAQQTPVLMLLAFAQLMIVTTGSIDISIGSSLAFSAFLGALGMLWFGDVGLILGIVAGGLVGMVNGLIISLLKIPSFVTTLAMLIIVRAVVIIASDGTAIYITDDSVSGGTNISSVAAPWLLSMGKFPAIFILAAIVALFMWAFYEKTVFGQQLRAVGGNEKVLRLVGINVTTFKIKVFAAAGLMVGLAACVNLARAGAATPQAGLMIELDAIAAVALGGTPLTGGYGSVVKTIIGALTLTIVRNGLTIAGVPPSWSQVALGVLLIAAIAISLNRSKVDVVK
ncbi:ABC transporter permease [Ruegeria sp. HKCCD8929]|uniref:ABC transporter permease n=1 Tax=Ruegeria sp. HKCCD8929 TaxID=2683006 RepID=UPI001488F65F|nr:ABC transporter permease [Ruegeria sp. HKCCD8929]